ncbi:LysR substrate-binding domain-containing protein [Variovorax terrae]|uniref:LysR substrate-binding domain-containing protein n=1 Tax=Variovorax terrae TaxID=2923278 RepID=A0A9X1VQY0_9BURK|nr:LysR substrate-binding domain-containing protein [Variovorax terrae]MCJ0761694.1 LysR substrate-binding domain-containing protein [Variovorax terrae]
MELRHLRYFVAVAEELNFTRAAERLYIAQPPLSTQIRGLEEELGVQLLERDKRRVYLTQAGRHFLDRARAILASVQSAKDEVKSAASGEVGKLSIGFTASSMLTRALPLAIRNYQEAFPSVELKMMEMPSLHQLDAIHQRSLDLGVLRKPNVGVPTGVTIEEWYSAPLVAAMPQQYVLTQGKGIYIRELKEVPLIVYPRDAGIGLYWKVLDLCAKSGFRPSIMQEARDASTIIGLVASGFGVAIVPHDTQCIQLEGVLYSRILDKDAVSSLYLGHRDADANPHLESFLRILRSVGGTRK